MRLSAFVTVVLLSAVSLAAQEAKTSAAIDVPMTSLELIVTDAKGARVNGLQKEEFEVVEEGQARTISNFSEMPPAGGDSARAGRQVMIAFDNVTLTLANRKAFAAAAREFVEKSLAPGDRVMVTTLLHDATVRLPWTSDRAAIVKSIDEVMKESPIGRAEQQRRRLEQDIKSTRTADAISASGSRGSTVSFDSLTTAVRNYSSAAMMESTQVVHALGGALRHFAPAPGRKVMIVAGEGLPLRPGADMWEYLESVRMDISAGAGSGSLQRSARSATPLGESSQYDIAPAIRAVALAARRNGVMIYLLNPGNSDKAGGGVEDQEFVNTSSDFARTAGQAGGYQVLARDTGGLAFPGSRANLALERIARDLDGGYSIGYSAGQAPKLEALSVRSKSGHRVRYTVVGGGISPEEAIGEMVMAHHASAPASNELGIVLAVDPAVEQEGKRRVALKVQIPVKSLRFDREGSEVTGGFLVFISPGDVRGGATVPTRQSQQLRWPADALAYLAEKSVTFAVDVVLEKGRNQVSIGVLDVKSNRTGFAKIAVP